MAYTSDIRLAAPHAIPVGGLLRKLSAFAADLSQRYARYRVYRDTVNELSALPDRALADLRLSRSQIRSTAYECAYGAQK